jgi:MFS family permease
MLICTGFGGAPLVLGGGTIADLIPRQQRGTAMAIWVMGPTIGPCVGPLIGGFLTVAKGWRWNFWFVAIVVRVLVHHPLGPLLWLMMTGERNLYTVTHPHERNIRYHHSRTESQASSR